MTGFDPSAVDPRHWQTADLAGAPARWLRLARLGTSDTSLGLLESGAWAAGRERIRVVDRQHAAPALLPALERSADWLRSELRARAAAVGLPASLVDAFPIAWVIEAGLGSESDHWARLALDWVEPGMDTPELRALLSQLSRAPRMPQPIRHRALRALRGL